MTTRVVALPLVLVAWAWISYFKTFSVNGHDVELIAIFTAMGIALGVASGLTTKVWESGQALGQVLARLSILQGRLYLHDRSQRAVAH